MTIFFTSDEHHFHRNILIYCNRPFADVNEMTRGLVERHNAVVRKGDIVYHLGDFSMNERCVPGVLAQSNGTHHLVPGNHDRCHPVHKKGFEAATARYLSYGFASIQTEIQNFEGRFVLNHLPYKEDNSVDTRTHYDAYRPVDRGAVLLSGHVHTAWKTRGRMINVGVDVHDYKPISLEEVLAIAEDIV